jgi:hypothetical protein
LKKAKREFDEGTRRAAEKANEQLARLRAAADEAAAAAKACEQRTQAAIDVC